MAGELHTAYPRGVVVMHLERTLRSSFHEKRAITIAENAMGTAVYMGIPL